METSPLTLEGTRKRGRNSDKASTSKKQRYSLRSMDKSRAENMSANTTNSSSTTEHVSKELSEKDLQVALLRNFRVQENLEVQLSCINKHMERNEDNWKAAQSRMDTIEKQVGSIQADVKKQIGAVSTRMDKVDDAVRDLQKNIEQMNNRTVKATANIQRDEQEISKCRKTVCIIPIRHSEDESEADLRKYVLEFFEENMNIPMSDLEKLGPMQVRRPLHRRYKGQEAPVEVIFDSTDERDFIFSRMRPLTEAKGERGRIFAKYPSCLQKLKRGLEAEAAGFRRDGRFWAQIRYVESDEILSLFLKDTTKDSPWLPKEDALRLCDEDPPTLSVIRTPTTSSTPLK